jgi:hypothetical protein
MRSSTVALIVALTSAACAVSSSPKDIDQTTDHLEAPRAAACTDATRPQVWADAAKQPLKPPRLIAGLDLGGGDGWPGISQAAVEEALCAGRPVKTDSDGPDDYFQWGEPDSVIFEAGVNRETRKVSTWSVGSGYTGGIEFRSRAGSRFGDHAYSIKIGSPILRDGQPFAIDWANQAALEQAATELHDAVSATFAPELPAEQTNCRTSQRCLIMQVPGNRGIIGVRDVWFYIDMSDLGARPTTPTGFYGRAMPAGLPVPPGPSVAPGRSRRLADLSF